RRRTSEGDKTPMRATTENPPMTQEQRHGLIAAIASIAIFGASLGHSLPFFAVLLERQGASNSFIGLNTATTPLFSLLVTPFLPAWIARYGIRKVMAGAFAVIYLGYAIAYVAGANLGLWFLVRICFGLGGAALFVASEVWINLAAPSARRGAILGLYTTALAAGFAAGPIALEITGYDGRPPFMAGIAFLALAAPPVLLARAPRFAPDAAHASLLKMARLAPSVFIAVAIFAAAEGVMMGLAPIYGIRLGMAEETAGRIVLAYALGPVAFQYLIGRAIDRFRPMPIFFTCAALGMAGAFFLPVAASAPLSLYLLLIFWGGAIVGLNTCGLAFIGARFKDRELAAANAGMAFAYAAGALVGPAVTGPMMDAFGPDALAYTLGAFFIVLLIALFLRRNAATP
ncbi:MAG: MFS transporter, partial [Pseudomonadota bacterium]